MRVVWAERVVSRRGNQVQDHIERQVDCNNQSALTTKQLGGYNKVKPESYKNRRFAKLIKLHAK